MKDETNGNSNAAVIGDFIKQLINCWEEVLILAEKSADLNAEFPH